MQQADLARKLEKGEIQCQACQRHCVISDQQLGFCLARQNVAGILYSLNHSQITGIQVDPIEKKPFYHFKPGSEVATIGSWGCNFRCKQCLNFAHSWGELATQNLKDLAQGNLEKRRPESAVSPEEIATTIADAGYSGIAFSYNEPVIWAEFARDTAKAFKKLKPKGFAVFVTNGSWTKETIDALAPYIAAANIDIKGFCQETYKKQGARLGIIPEMTKYAQNKGIFLEITTLLIPGINDDPDEIRDLTEWIVKDLGPDTPWHLSQFDPKLAPDPEFKKIPLTTNKELEKAANIGKEAGLHHIYIWAPATNCAISDTTCPNCHNTVINRSGWELQSIKIHPNHHCQFCNYKLNVIL
jgi:pyruvate formate lyase activating enzyme